MINIVTSAKRSLLAEYLSNPCTSSLIELHRSTSHNKWVNTIIHSSHIENNTNPILQFNHYCHPYLSIFCTMERVNFQYRLIWVLIHRTQALWLQQHNPGFKLICKDRRKKSFSISMHDKAKNPVFIPSWSIWAYNFQRLKCLIQQTPDDQGYLLFALVRRSLSC